MAQTIQTKKAKDLAQEISAAKMQTAKAIIWNSGEELKQVSVNTLVNENVTKDYVPTMGSTKLITSGGVWDALDSLETEMNSGLTNLGNQKEDKSKAVTFHDEAELTLADNTIYTADEDIYELEVTASQGSSVLSFDTASSGYITIIFPASIKFPETPTFGNSEHWEIAVRNGYAVYTKYDL